MALSVKKGDKVTVNGKPMYTSYGGNPGKQLNNYSGTVTHLNTKEGVPYPIHVDSKGWFAQSAVTTAVKAEDVAKAKSVTVSGTTIAPNKARRTVISLLFAGVDISAELAKYLISLTYTDNESGTADDIAVELDDIDLIWLNGYLNKKVSGEDLKGHWIDVTILLLNHNDDGKSQRLSCGKFQIDSVGYSGPPNKISLKASAIAKEASMKNEKKSKAWEGVTLEMIGKEIANSAGYKFLYESTQRPMYKHVEQVNQCDLDFLNTLCLKAGIALKVTNEQLVMFDAAEYEKKSKVKTFHRTASGVISYDFDSEDGDASYTACKVTYTDPNTKKKIEATFTNPNATTKGETLQIKNEKVADKAEALELAQKKLRAKNKGENTGTLTVAGDVELVAGLSIELDGFGAFNGKWYIEKATHKVTKGYTTALQIRKVIEEY